MKKLITLCLFLVMAITLFAQDWNDISIEITPENPNTNDEIVISVSGQTTSNLISVNTAYTITENGTIVVQTEVYQGMYAVVENFEAENNIGSLVAGSYEVVANVDYFVINENGDYTQFDNKQGSASFEVLEVDYNQIIFGYVTSISEDGETLPIAGATITVMAADLEIESTITDENGFYELAFYYDWYGPVTVVCEAEGYNSETVTFFPESEEHELNFTLTPISNPEEIHLFGYVNFVTENGITFPIEGATIRIDQLSDDEFATTDENGFYEITFDYIWNGPITAICELEGYELQSVTFFPDGPEHQLDFTFVLDQNLILFYGTVYGEDSAGNEQIPIEGAIIRILELPDGEFVTTNANGYYVFYFEWPVWGPVTVECSAEGYVTETETVWYPTDMIEEVNFSLTPISDPSEIFLYGYVNGLTNDGDLQPIENATVQSVVSGEFATTNENGYYELSFIWNWDSAVVINCAAEGYESETVSFFPENQQVELNFELEPISQDFGFLIGHIGSNVDWYFDDGTNIENAFVHIYNAMYEAETYSDDNGIFQFELPPAGGYSSYTILATAEYYEDTYVSYIEIGEGDTTYVEVVMQPAYNLGDVDDNGDIQAFDAAATLQYSADLVEFEEWQIWSADVDGNGQIQAFDAALILQYSAGLIDEFPINAGINLIDESNSGCLNSKDEEAYIEVFVNGNEMTLFFFHPSLNCGLIADWSGWLEDDIFYVEMDNIGQPTDCECPFELTVTFGPFEVGTYTLDFWNGDFGYPIFTIEE